MTQEPKTIEIKLPKLHPGQMEAKSKFKRFNVLAIGRRFGKTTMGLHEICTKAIEGKDVCYIAPNYSLTTKFFKGVSSRLIQIVKSVNAKDHIIELITGGSIQTFSFESIDNIRGNSFDFVVIDEAAYCNNLLTEWDSAIRATLIDRKGTALFISSPNGFNQFYDLFEKGNKEKDWFSIQMPSHKNPFLPKEELELVKESMTQDAYEREILAQFNDVSATVFKKAWIQKVSEVPEDLSISFGCDLAISKSNNADFTCISVVGHHAQTNKYYLLALFRAHLSFVQILDKITQMAEIYKPSVIAIEATAFQRVVSDTLMEQTTLPIIAIRPTVDKVSRAMPLAARFEKGDFYILDSDSVDEAVYTELLAFPNPKVKDDTIDSMEMGFTALSQTQPFVFSI